MLSAVETLQWPPEAFFFSINRRIQQGLLKYNTGHGKDIVDIFTEDFCFPFLPESFLSLQESPILYKILLEKLVTFLIGLL